jgi:triacylglycerol lipase
MNAPNAKNIAPSEAARAVASEIRRLGPFFNDEVLKASYALYAPLHERAPRSGTEVHRDLAYGDDPRHRLDVHVASKRPGGPAPVVAFFHGGGYVAGERSPVPGLIYDNVPTFFARHGMIGVNATYRLAPAHQWPSGGEDVGRVVDWLVRNAARYGGDPQRIFLVGHSAGATHAATWTFMESVHGAGGPRIAGAMLISGVYAALHPEYSSETPRENQFAYYGRDVDAWAGMAPYGHIKADHPAVFVIASEHEPYYFAWPSVALVAALVKRDRRMPWHKFLPDHNHVSSALQINSEIDTLGPELLNFINSVR